MSWELEYDETRLPPDRPCAKCASIGYRTVCIQQHRDKSQPSCLHDNTTEAGNGTLDTITGDATIQDINRELWAARYRVDYLRQSAADGCYLCQKFLYNSEPQPNSETDLRVSLKYGTTADYLQFHLLLGPHATVLKPFTLVQGMWTLTRATCCHLPSSTTTWD